MTRRQQLPKDREARTQKSKDLKEGVQAPMPAMPRERTKGKQKAKATAKEKAKASRKEKSQL